MQEPLADKVDYYRLLLVVHDYKRSYYQIGAVLGVQVCFRWILPEIANIPRVET